MSKKLNGVIAGTVVACLLGVSPAYAIFGSTVRRTVMAAKAGAGVADKTSDEEINDKINANLAYLEEEHRLDRTAMQEKTRS
jgi:hypothetical protein